MKRDEQIKSEALKKAREVYMCNLCSWKQDCEFMGGQNTPYECMECAGDDFRIGFEAGAKWADENPKQELVNLSQVWHAASEEPKNGEFILVEVVNTIPTRNDTRYFIEYSEEWMVKLMKTDGFKCRWAYIKDLLPKGGIK